MRSVCCDTTNHSASPDIRQRMRVKIMNHIVVLLRKYLLLHGLLGKILEVPGSFQAILRELLSTLSCFPGKKFMIQLEQRREGVLGAISKPPNKIEIAGSQ